MKTRIAAVILALLMALPAANAQTTYWLSTSKVTVTETTYDFNTKAPDYLVDWLKAKTPIGGGDIVAKTIKGRQYQFVKQTVSWPKPLQSGMWIEKDSSPTKFGVGEWKSNNDFKTQSAVIKALESNVKHSIATHAKAEVLVLIHQEDTPPRLVFTAKASDFDDSKTVATAPKPAPAPMPQPAPATDPAVLAFDPPSLAFVWQKGGPFPPSQSVLARNCGGYTIHSGFWANKVRHDWVPGGCQMDIGVDPVFAKLDVGVHETKILLESNGMKANLLVKITVVSTDGTLQVNRKRLHFGGFLGDAIKEQVIDVTYTGVGTTNWTASGPAWLKLSKPGGTVAATDPTTLSVGINTAAITVAGRNSGTLKVSDGKTTHEIPVDLSLVPPGSPTIELYGLEVTQGIQNLFNDIPFVANRPTFVRGHVRSLTGDPIEKATAQLVGMRDGTNLGTLAPINPGGSINIIAVPDRGKLDESFLFELPPAWLTGKVTLHLEGKSHPIAYADPAEKIAAASDADSLATSAVSKSPKMTATSQPASSQVAQGDWQEKLALTHDRPVLSLVWSPNSKKIVAKDQGNNGRVWDVTTGKLDLNGGGFEGALLGWSPNSTTIAYQRVSTQTGSQPGDSDVCFSNYTDIFNDPINKQRSLFPPTQHFAWSWPKLAYATTDSVTIMDGTTAAKLLTIEVKDAYRVAWSPNGGTIATAAPFNAGDAKTDHKIFIHDAKSGKQLAAINAPLIGTLMFSPDGSKVAAAAASRLSEDKIHVWDAITGKELVSIPDLGAHEVTWSPDGSKIATGCNSDHSAGVGKVWNGATGAALYTLKGASKVRAGQWSPDGSKIVTQGRNDLGIWNAENGDNLHQQRFDSQIHDVAWSPDGSRIAVALGNGTVRVLAAPIAPTPKPAITATTPKPASPTSEAKPDDGTVTLTFQTIPALPIEYYLYSEQGSVKLSDGRQIPMTYTANSAYAAATSQQLLAGLPIPRVDDTIHPTTSTFPGERTTARQKEVDAIMRETYQKAGSPLRHTYGLFVRYEPPTDPKAQPAGGPGGAACVPGFFGFGEYYTFQPMATLNMHEIGHNLGRNHVDCGKPASPDTKYPHPNQQISDELTGPAAYYGFNIVTKKDIYPPTYKDYMSYCHPEWVSPYTYKAMMEKLKIHYKKPDDAGGQSASSPPAAPILLVSGSITGAGTGTVAGSVDNVVDDNAGAAIPIPAPDGSKYNVRLLDAAGRMIATYAVTPQTSASQAADGREGHEDLTSFTLAVPRPKNMGRVVLFAEDKLVAERKASANAPTVKITTQLGGKTFGNQAFPLTWKAADADGNELRFNVDYSIDDGATWNAMARNWSETTLQVDSSRLAGSAKARLRVSANDGFLTTFAVSDAFTVSDHPPVAVILSKDLNRYYVGGQTILLNGTGYDVEDGVLNELTWYSDRNGKLGTGRTLSLNADDLAEGAHVIRLEARDSQGQSSFGDPAASVAASVDDSFAVSDSVRFNVHLDPLSVPAELLAASVLSGKTQRIEAETGTYAGGARTDSSNKGFEGTGFAAYFLPGAEVALNVTTDQAGVHDLVIRYAAGQHGPESTRTLSLYVNGSRTQQLSFERTGDWLNWANQTAKVQLKSGENTISFRVDKGDTGYINLDYLILGVEKSPPRLRVNPGLTNSSFEEPRGKEASFVLVETMPGWKTTDTHFEIWSTGFKDVAAHEGTQFVELNAYIDGTLYQDSTGIEPDSVLEFTFAHRGRNGEDTMKLTITDLGADNSLDGGDDTVLFTKEYSTGKDAWAVYNSTKEKQIKALGNTVRFAYRAISSATGELGEGNFLDAADFGVGVVTSHPTLAPVKHEAAYGTKRLHTFGVGGKSSENHYLGVRNSQVGIPDEKNPSSGDILVLNVKQTDNGAVLTNQAGKYLTARGQEVVLSDTPEQGSYWLIRDPKKSDVRASDGWFSLELASDPGRYLRHFQLKAFAHKEEELGQNEKSLFLPDATWRFVDAKTFEYSMEVISGNGQSYGGGGMPDAMVIRIKDKSGKPVTDLKGAGLTIDVSANTPGTYDSAFSNLSIKRNDKTLFEGYYYVPGNKGAPYKLQITVQLKKAGNVVGECVFTQNIK